MFTKVIPLFMIVLYDLYMEVQTMKTIKEIQALKHVDFNEMTNMLLDFLKYRRYLPTDTVSGYVLALQTLGERSGITSDVLDRLSTFTGGGI
jgi:hypothetical protein